MIFSSLIKESQDSSWLLLALFLLIPLFGWSQTSPTKIENPRSIEIAIEHARTPQELTRGLMRRPSLPLHTGMLFSFPDEQIRSFWMYRTLIDLSVAFLDSDHVIREIYEMKAYPQRSDPAFFSAHRTNSLYPTQYALEMNKHWFKNQDVKVGDMVSWNEGNKAFVVKTIDVSSLLSEKEQSTIFELPEKSPITLWLPNEEHDHLIIFFDSEGNPMQSQLLKGGKKLPAALKPVVQTNDLTRYLMVLPTKINLDSHN